MQVKYWVSMCERHGEDSLLPRRLNYSGEFKVTVIEDMYTNKLTLYNTALKYCIPSPSTVLSWKRLYDISAVPDYTVIIKCGVKLCKQLKPSKK